jgi:hypothetical protein
MTITEEMILAASKAWHEDVAPWTVDRASMRRALEAAEAVRPVPALPTREEIARRLDACAVEYLPSEDWLAMADYVLDLPRQHAPSAPPEPEASVIDLSDKPNREVLVTVRGQSFAVLPEVLDALSEISRNGELVVTLGNVHNFCKVRVATRQPPVPDTRSLQVTEDEWREYMYGQDRSAYDTPLDWINSILARRPGVDPERLRLDLLAKENALAVERETCVRLRAQIAEPRVAWSVVERWKADFAAQRDRAEAAEAKLDALRKACTVSRDEVVAIDSDRRRATEGLVEYAVIRVAYIDRVQAALQATQSPIPDTADKSPSDDNVFGDAGNDFFAQQHMLSQPPGALPEERRIDDVARDLLECASNWEPGARLLGNITAHDIKRLAQVTPGALAKIEARLDRHEKALRKIASATMWATNDGNAVRALLDAKGGEHG